MRIPSLLAGKFNDGDYIVEDFLGIVFLKDGIYINGSFLKNNICVLVKVFIRLRWGEMQICWKNCFY